MPEQLPRQSNEDPRGRRVQPGVYDRDGVLHFDVAELLRDRGIEPTPEAVEISARNLQKAASELGLPTEVVDGG
jgi:hypothetical protein